MELDAATIVRNFDTLKGERARLNSQLEQAAALCNPAKYGGSYMIRTNSQQNGQATPVEIVCDFPQEAATKFQRGLFSNLFPPTVRWFGFAPSASAENTAPQNVKTFLSKASQTLYDILYSTNFPVELAEVCSSISHEGTVPMSVVFDPRRLLKFKCHPLSSVYCQESRNETIDTIYNELQLSAGQARNIFDRPGDRLGEKLRKDAESSDVSRHDKTYRIIHYVGPNRQRKFVPVKRDGRPSAEPVPGPEGAAFTSIYVEADEKIIIRKEGFERNPFVVGRIDECVGSDVYGMSPALRALRSMKMLNKLMSRYIDAVDASLRPSVIADLAAYTDLLPEFFFDPGSVNLYNSQGGKFNAPSFYTPPANLPGGLDLINQIKTTVNSFFAADMFTLIQNMNEQSGRQRTAREIVELVNERNSQILTIVSRFLDELCSPLLLNCFWILYDNTTVFGDVDPEVADYLKQQGMTVSYFSPFALAARATRIQGTIAAVEDCASLLQLDPQALDVLDADKLVRDVFEVRGAYPEHLRDDSDVAAIRKQRAEAQQRQLAMQQMADVAKSQNLTQRPDDGSVVGQLLGM